MDRAADSSGSVSVIEHEPSTTRTTLPQCLRDITAAIRMFVTAGISTVIGCTGTGPAWALPAWALLELILLCTLSSTDQRWSFDDDSPADNTLGRYSVIVPIAGGLIPGSG